jgi:hypothetical protein
VRVRARPQDAQPAEARDQKVDAIGSEPRRLRADGAPSGVEIPRVEILQDGQQPPEVFGAEAGYDVEALGGATSAEERCRGVADDHVFDVMAVEGAEQLSELRHGADGASTSPWSPACSLRQRCSRRCGDCGRRSAGERR